MSTINNITTSSARRVEVSAPQRSATQPSRAETTHTSSRAPDTVSLSDQARYLDAIRETPEIRLDLVQRIRSEIAAGTYESFDKFETAVTNLIDDLAAE